MRTQLDLTSALGISVPRCGPCGHHAAIHTHQSNPTTCSYQRSECLLDAALVMKAHSHAPARMAEHCRDGCCWQQRASASHTDLSRARRDVATLFSRRNTSIWLSDAPEFPLRSPAQDVPDVVLAEGQAQIDWNRPRVAIVGTRSASPHGLLDAAELGALMAEAGVIVLSGLALGIDAAAHRGTIKAGGIPVGVVGTGLDQVYPRRHGELHRQVHRSGALLSQFWYGVGPRAYHFPIRNRLLAVLADVVIVVEATATGGTHSTVDHALGAGRPVMAIPGSRRNPAAVGCNRLIADGAIPLLEPEDVLTQLGMVVPEPTGSDDVTDSTARADRDDELLGALAGEPATIEQLAQLLGLDFQQVTQRVGAAIDAGIVLKDRGFVWPS